MAEHNNGHSYRQNNNQPPMAGTTNASTAAAGLFALSKLVEAYQRIAAAGGGVGAANQTHFAPPPPIPAPQQFQPSQNQILLAEFLRQQQLQQAAAAASTSTQQARLDPVVLAGIFQHALLQQQQQQQQNSLAVDLTIAEQAGHNFVQPAERFEVQTPIRQHGNTGRQRRSRVARQIEHEAASNADTEGVEELSFKEQQSTSSQLMFSLHDLNLALYGRVLRSDETPTTPTSTADQPQNLSQKGHAISCLNLGRISKAPNGLSTSTGRSNRSGGTGIPDSVLLDIPEGLSICQTSVGGCIHYSVICRRSTGLSVGSRFGPFQGRLVNPSEMKTHDDNTQMWEVFKDNKLSHFVDGRGSNCNWLAYVNTARFPGEQNLVALQENGQIFYETCCHVENNAELLVWYGEEYAQMMGIPIGLKGEAAAMEVSSEISGEAAVESAQGYQCERCGKVFAYKYYRDKHLKYTRCVDMGDRKFPCQLCSRSFEKRDRLRIHVLHVHEKHRPHKCTVCSKSFSQSSSLNKHMRVHSGERPYKCVYCSKAFTASSILRTHIRQHSGEKPFKCRHCGKSFASHAAHDSHVRRTHLMPANGGPPSSAGVFASGSTTVGDILMASLNSPTTSSPPLGSGGVVLPGEFRDYAGYNGTTELAVPAIVAPIKKRY